MQTKNDNDLSKALTAATAKHIAPIFLVSPVDVIFQGTSATMEDQGTMTFVSYEGHCFGLTNQHVTKGFDRNRADAAFMLALNKHIPLPGRLVFTTTANDIDFPFDLSVFILNEEFIRSGGKQPIAVQGVEKPAKEGEKYLALGYPGHVRGQILDKTSHPIYHIVATCQCASDRKIVLQDEIPLSKDAIRFGGISGGLIVNPFPDDSYSLIGIIFEGRAPEEEVDHRSSDTDIWVYGVPVTTDLMDKVLADINARNISLDVQPRHMTFNLKEEADHAPASDN